MAQKRRRVAFSIGDPAGIGCEIILKALQRLPRVDAVVVGDARLIAENAQRIGIEVRSDVLDVPGLDMGAFRFGETSAANGRSIIACTETAIRLAQAGGVDAVIAAPQNQTSIRAAGIPFDGYSGFFARTVGLAEDAVYLMLVSDRFKIAHVTTHLPVRAAIDRVRREYVQPVIAATNSALIQMGINRPRIAVSGLNPHAGENGLFGSEDRDHILPAVAAARAQGIDVTGPLGADVMLASGGYDGYVVMLHDQGHIPGKLQSGCAAFAIGGPFLLASVAHGSAHDIAGQGVADETHMYNTIRWTLGAL